MVDSNQLEAFDQKEQEPESLLSSNVVYTVIHIVCLLLYIVPLVNTYPNYEDILDETHIDQNDDVNGVTPLIDVFLNDYWGRRMNAHNSHKSWRPFSILLFRILRSHGNHIPTILFDRIIGLFIHAALAELVSNCACLLFPQSTKKHQSSIRIFTKLLFAFHPTHVEAVSNSANRPHLLAVMFSMLAVDFRTPFIFLPPIVALACTSCETATFQLPAILITLTVNKWRK